MPTPTTTTFHQVSRIEFEYHADTSDPSFSFLRLLIHSPDSSTRRHSISFFAHDAASADYLHSIFLASSLMLDPPGKPPQPDWVETDEPSQPKEQSA